jgi:hypothetical protein
MNVFQGHDPAFLTVLRLLQNGGGPLVEYLTGRRTNIDEDGVYLLLAFVWLSLILIAWLFDGGFRRKFPNQPHVRASIGIIVQPHTTIATVTDNHYP